MTFNANNSIMFITSKKVSQIVFHLMRTSTLMKFEFSQSELFS